ncbi:zf-HC2 domain-containing protein [Herbaspirillum rubrisubalbicans]|uniref:Putative zinc-finger domain-containing protein n=1 Tax=Herbaspirillum rubrisubalbicans Os34 TaxID=1235827 RepID=A0A6M3ZS34_9BURK|nr:zf-HC2 domain-containing protein [Herbaspirillum rubrisubalbicans]QJQ01073.1 hypothetical protein C798_12755 [Herbaspirillum rubrisubalbicans Os34]
MTEYEIYSHDEIERLLPWFVNGTLDEDQQQAIRIHLKSCAKCNAAYEWACRERAVIHMEQDPIPDVEANLARMMARIGPASSKAPSKAKAGKGAALFGKLFSWFAPRPWLPVALAIQTVLIVALGLGGLMQSNVQQSDAKQYVALSDANTGKMKIAIVFRPDTTVQKMQDILRAINANIVAGPTVTFAYVVEVPVSEEASAVRHFKLAPEISLVQSLGQGN